MKDPSCKRRVRLSGRSSPSSPTTICSSERSQNGSLPLGNINRVFQVRRNVRKTSLLTKRGRGTTTVSLPPPISFRVSYVFHDSPHSRSFRRDGTVFRALPRRKIY